MFVPLDQQQRLDYRYDEIRSNYEEILIYAGGYEGKDLSEINDGRDEFIAKEYDLYISQSTERYQNKNK